LIGLVFWVLDWIKGKLADEFEKVQGNSRLAAKRIMQQSAYNSSKITMRDMVIDYKTKNLRGTGTLRCRYILVVALVEKKKSFGQGRSRFKIFVNYSRR
jgi:hypothetical protein